MNEIKGLSCLVNIKRMSFMNSVVQCLGYTEPLRSYFLSGRYLNDLSRTPEAIVTISFTNLLRAMWDQNQIVKPKSFFENVSIFHKKYFSMQCFDAKEFLVNLFCLFNASLSYPVEFKSVFDSGLLQERLNSLDAIYNGTYSEIYKIFAFHTADNSAVILDSETDTGNIWHFPKVLIVTPEKTSFSYELEFQETVNKAIFDLYAIVHKTPHAFCAYCKGTSGNWYRFDDTSVTICHGVPIEEADPSDIFFYQRRTIVTV